MAEPAAAGPEAAGTDRPGQQHDLQRDGRAVRPRGASLQTQGAQALPDQAAALPPGPRHTARAAHRGSWTARCHLGPPGATAAAGPAGCPGMPAPAVLLLPAQSHCLRCLLPNVYLHWAYKHVKQTGREEEHQRREEARRGQPCLLPPCSAADKSPFSNRHGPVWVWSWEQLGWESCLSSPKRKPAEMPPDAVRGTPAKQEPGRKKGRESPCSLGSPWPQHLHSERATRQCPVVVSSTELPVTLNSSALPFLQSTTW